MQIWILTKTTDIDPTQILGAYDHETGTSRFTDEATAMLKNERPSLSGEDDEPAPDVLTATTIGENGALSLEVRGDWLRLEPFEYTTTHAATPASV